MVALSEEALARLVLDEVEEEQAQEILRESGRRRREGEHLVINPPHSTPQPPLASRLPHTFKAHTRTNTQTTTGCMEVAVRKAHQVLSLC